MTEPITPEQRADVVYALLKAGVPATAIARALGMDAEHVQGARSMMLVERYGTDEIAEAMAWLQWEAYEEALNQIHTGTPANKARFIQLVLARSIGLAGKSSPETSEKIRAALDQMAADTQPVVQLQDSIYTPSD
jgi:hypothetical protein